MSAKDILEMSSAIVGLISVIASIIGTFWLTQLYHAFKPKEFLRSVGRAVINTLRANSPEAFDDADVAKGFGGFKDENKAKSLVGVYWIFVGFVLQGIASLLAIAALLLALNEPPKASPCPPCNGQPPTTASTSVPVPLALGLSSTPPTP